MSCATGSFKASSRSCCFFLLCLLLLSHSRRTRATTAATPTRRSSPGSIASEAAKDRDSDADGTALSDVDWEAKGNHYRVRIEGQWFDVPDEAVITEPNRVGKTMVWPIYNRALGGTLSVEIRCFMPGSMI